MINGGSNLLPVLSPSTPPLLPFYFPSASSIAPAAAGPSTVASSRSTQQQLRGLANP